jgi:hypothetical protein
MGKQGTKTLAAIAVIRLFELTYKMIGTVFKTGPFNRSGTPPTLRCIGLTS